MIGILLAAGRGTRMKNEKPKVLFEINDEPMCFTPCRVLLETCDQVAVVIGYKGFEVQAALKARAIEVFGEAVVKMKLSFFTQDPPKGTGDAVRTAIDGLGASLVNKHDVVVLNGDLPLIRRETIDRMTRTARDGKLSSLCLSMRMARPAGLGRILRDEKGVFVGIREEKDATSDEKTIREVNGGVYWFEGKLLSEAIRGLKTNNKQGEFYLTDLLGNKERSRRSEALMLKTHWDLLGVNTTFELSTARKMAQARLQKRICEEQGVDLLDPATTYISARAEFKGASRIGPGTVIRGTSVIETGADVDGQCFIENSRIGPKAHILWGSVIRDSQVGPSASVGPMAHLRPGSELEEGVKIGNFVELKKTRMGKGAKASHLSYLGDATVGDEANIGCGTITCNYDGYNKSQTVIGARAFVGSDTQLVAPVTVGEGAYIGSGTTVTRDVPADALALSRPPLVVKEGYAIKLARLAKARSKK